MLGTSPSGGDKKQGEGAFIQGSLQTEGLWDLGYVLEDHLWGWDGELQTPKDETESLSTLWCKKSHFTL